MIEKVCEECRASYNVNNARGKISRFCSVACKNKNAIGKTVYNTGQFKPGYGTKDMVGQRFGKLVIMSFSHMEKLSNGKTTSVWKVACDCGNELYVRLRNLTGKHRRSQCDDCSPRRIDKYSPIKNQFRGAKTRAKKYKKEFSISLEYMFALLELQNNKCAISGIPLLVRPSTSARHLPGGRTPHILSIDRIDTSKGYVEGNVQWVTAQVNQAKSDFTQEEFDEMCRARVKILDSGVI